MGTGIGQLMPRPRFKKYIFYWSLSVAKTLLKNIFADTTFQQILNNDKSLQCIADLFKKICPSSLSFSPNVCAYNQFGISLQGNVECHQQSSCLLPSEVNIMPETQNVNGEIFSAVAWPRSLCMLVGVWVFVRAVRKKKKRLHCIIYCLAARPLRETMTLDSSHFKAFHNIVHMLPHTAPQLIWWDMDCKTEAAMLIVCVHVCHRSCSV